MVNSFPLQYLAILMTLQNIALIKRLVWVRNLTKLYGIVIFLLRL